MEVVRLLVSAGADVNKTDGEGNTALFYALQGACPFIGAPRSGVPHFRTPLCGAYTTYTWHEANSIYQSFGPSIHPLTLEKSTHLAPDWPIEIFIRQ